MKSQLSQGLIDKLEPGEKPFEIRDSVLKGFLLRVQPSGLMTYYLEYERGKRVKLGRTADVKPHKARERAKKKLAIAYDGGDPAADKKELKTETFKEFLESVWLPHAETHTNSAEITHKRFKSAFPGFMKKRLTEITPFAVEKWRADRMRQGASRSTVNREFDDLKSALNKAETWELIQTNPIAKMRRLKIDKMPAVRYLSPDEEQRLRQALDDRELEKRQGRDSANQWRRERGYPETPAISTNGFVDHVKPIILLSLNTGCRRGELFNLTWRDVDLKRKQITIQGEGAKSGQTRYIDLNSEATAILETWKGQSAETGYVFPGKSGRLDNITKAYQGILKAAKIEKFRWHDLRHTFASNLVQRGVDLNTVRELLGHSSYQMTLRYAHLAPHQKSAAVELLVEENP